MPLSITADWEHLSSGCPEDRACFGQITIQSGNRFFTEAQDYFVNRTRTGVYLSAYRLAEWFAWNWWRLRWEPQAKSHDWLMAHHMSAIGGGYIWPNITITSDGERIQLVARPTRMKPSEPIRYLSDEIWVFSALEYENAISAFIELVLEKLKIEKVENTNLEVVWADIQAERNDQESRKYRKLEAILGCDADDAEPSFVERILGNESEYGEQAILELAATPFLGQEQGSLDAIRKNAAQFGMDYQPSDMIDLADPSALDEKDVVAAWRHGAQAAGLVRQQTDLQDAPLSNSKLSEMCGISEKALTDRKVSPDFSFSMRETSSQGKIAFRSKWETGRRFELARLLGDHIASGIHEFVSPVTRSYTYRQKMQRSFAAELLCPANIAIDRLGDDFSPENQEEAARYFEVSPLTIGTILANNDLIERESLSREF